MHTQLEKDGISVGEHRVDEEGLGIMPTKTSHRISATLPGNQIKVKADSFKTTISS